MTQVFISPTEPAPIKTLGRVSSVPEQHGADILLVGKWGLFGVQRKEVKDLVNSARDGRVAKELGQMTSLNYAAWLIEGKWNWTAQGDSLTVPTFTRSQYRGVTYSLQSRGYWLMESTSTIETLECISQLSGWLEKDSHDSLMRRPNPTATWGKVDNRDWGCHILQSFDGISYKLAGRIYDHFGGVPMGWLVTIEELMEVEGIGEKRAVKMHNAMLREVIDAN